jgi:hypothetical protein
VETTAQAIATLDAVPLALSRRAARRAPLIYAHGTPGPSRSGIASRAAPRAGPLSEASAIPFQARLLPAERLPTFHHDVHVPGVQVHPTAQPPALLRHRQRGPRAQKRLIHPFPAMIVLVFPAAAHDELRRRCFPDGSVLPGFPYQGALFFRTNQQGSCANQYKVRVSTARSLCQMICW